MRIQFNIKGFTDFIIGNEAERTSEKTLYTGTVLIMLVILFPIMISNYTFGLDPKVNYIIIFFGIPALGLLYYMARFRDYFPVGYLVATLLIFMSASWVFNGGAHGTIPVIYIVASLAIVGISKPKYHYFVFLIFFLHLIFMLLLEEYVIGDLIIPYPTPSAHNQDMIFSYGAAMFIVFWILRFYILAYNEENKKLERQKNELEKNIALKNMYFTIMVHDLKGSFNHILGFTELIKDQENSLSPEKSKKFAELTHFSAQQSYELLESILEWSRIQHDTFELRAKKINLFKIVSKIESESSVKLNHKNIRFQNEIDKDIRVKSDSYYLETILRNLINNAIKFTEEGGEISIKSTDFGTNELAVSVSDTGIGMDEYWVQNIFNLDFDSKRPGTLGEPSHGIGLKICKELTQKQDSQIFVESEPGKGSTFTFTVPKRI